MSFITPILMVPSLYWACAAPHPNAAAASAARLINRFIWRSPWLAFVGWRPGPQIPRRHTGHVGQYGRRQGAAAMSHAQINVKLVEIGLQFGIGEAVDDAAMFHHV